MLVALCLAAVALAAIALCAHMRRSEAIERAEWTKERQILLERVQRPERPLSVVGEAPQYVVPDVIPDESNLVGQIVNDPEAYLRFQEESVGD